jgi:hypothetical protein
VFVSTHAHPSLPGVPSDLASHRSIPTPDLAIDRFWEAAIGMGGEEGLRSAPTSLPGPLVHVTDPTHLRWPGIPPFPAIRPANEPQLCLLYLEVSDCHKCV